VRRFIAVAVVAAAVAVPAVALGSAGKTVKLEAKLSGKTEVPKAGAATGEAYIQITGSKVCWQFKDLKGVAGATASHIHKAAVGKAGPVVVPLGGAFKTTGCTTATAALTKAIAAKPSAFYVNIHTGKYPAGALRGQLGDQD
jgi:CHRD domain